MQLLFIVDCFTRFIRNFRRPIFSLIRDTEYRFSSLGRAVIEPEFNLFFESVIFQMHRLAVTRDVFLRNFFILTQNVRLCSSFLTVRESKVKATKNPCRRCRQLSCRTNAKILCTMEKSVWLIFYKWGHERNAENCKYFGRVSRVLNRLSWPPFTYSFSTWFIIDLIQRT